MSRSYKKHPWCGDHKGKSKKRMAWKSVRRWLKENPDASLQGGQYKKIYETWDICDYGWTCTWEEYWKGEIESWEKWDKPRNRPFPNKKEVYRKWLKYYKVK